MGGQASTRGYLFQTLNTLFEAFTGGRKWDAVEIEPNVTSEKVDGNPSAS